VIIECLRGTVPLLASVAGVEQVVAFGDPLPSFDVQCPMMSLARVFKTNLDNIPADAPYLHAPPDRVEQWRARLAAELPEPERFRVGACLGGEPGSHQ